MESADGVGGCRAPLGSQPPSSRRRPPSALTERSSSTRPPTPRTYVRISSFSSSLPYLCCRRAVIDSGPSPPGHVGIRGLRPSLPLCVASSGPGSAVAWRRPCSPGSRHPAHSLASPRERRGSMHTICMFPHLPRADWSALAAEESLYPRICTSCECCGKGQHRAPREWLVSLARYCRSLFMIDTVRA